MAVTIPPFPTPSLKTNVNCEIPGLLANFSPARRARGENYGGASQVKPAQPIPGAISQDGDRVPRRRTHRLAVGLGAG
jgi:hypothetical protein